MQLGKVQPIQVNKQNANSKTKQRTAEQHKENLSNTHKVGKKK